jgi:geranylgeranyl diphosphate synthase, type I
MTIAPSLIGSGSVGIAEYMSMARNKTGALLGSACALGALWAGADSIVTTALYRFGCTLRIAFQCVDDTFRVWGDPAITGKPLGSDLAMRKWMLPVVAAAASDSDAGGG